MESEVEARVILPHMDMSPHARNWNEWNQTTQTFKANYSKTHTYLKFLVLFDAFQGWVCKFKEEYGLVCPRKTATRQTILEVFE